MSRSTLATLTHDLWLVCCGRLTHRMLPGWCLCMPDSNLGPVLPAGREPALFPTSCTIPLHIPHAHACIYYVSDAMLPCSSLSSVVRAMVL